MYTLLQTQDQNEKIYNALGGIQESVSLLGLFSSFRDFKVKSGVAGDQRNIAS